MVTTEATRGPVVIDRKDQQRLATVRANVAGRDQGAVGLDVQAPLARAVVGGLIASTLITLVLIPAVYALVHPDPQPPASSR